MCNNQTTVAHQELDIKGVSHKCHHYTPTCLTRGALIHSNLEMLYITVIQVGKIN